MKFHYSEVLLDQYRNGDLSPVAGLLCRFHLMFCSKCRRELASLRESDCMIKELQRLEKSPSDKE